MPVPVSATEADDVFFLQPMLTIDAAIARIMSIRMAILREKN